MNELNRIFTLLKARGITQSQLANSIGVSAGNVTDWKTGRSSPNPIMLTQIARYFNVSTDYLLGLSDSTQLDAYPITSLTSKQQKLLKEFDQLNQSQQDIVLAQITSMNKIKNAEQKQLS